MDAPIQELLRFSINSDDKHVVDRDDKNARMQVLKMMKIMMTINMMKNTMTTAIMRMNDDDDDDGDNDDEHDEGDDMKIT